MIGYLKGSIIFRHTNYIILNVHDVGYKIFISPSAFKKIQESESTIALFIYTHVREESLDLFGFFAQEDLVLFELLLTVSGIGPKTALGVYAIGETSEIITAITQSNIDFFLQVPRLGKKNAQKIIIELAQKVSSGIVDTSSLFSSPAKEEVIVALETLGFTKQEAEKTYKLLPDTLSIEEKIRQALKYLGKRS